MKLSVRTERARLEDLEPRILFSADTPVALVGAALHEADAAAHTQLMQAQAGMEQTAHELVFIDAHVQDAQKLADDVAAQAAAGRSIEAVMLDANSDGIDQISAALADRQGVTAIHLIAHGADASLTLGNTTLDGDALLMRAGEIAGWGSHLSADADLLIYSCDFAAQPDGQALVQNLAQLTGADVAASNDLTGASALGGNWKLEVTSGHIESALAIDAIGQGNFHQVLASYTVTNTNDSGAGSLRQAITSANGNGGTDTINFAIAGTGVHTITLATALPTLTEKVSIDATTDNSFAANGNKPAIVINGNGLNANGLELTSTADGSTIRGLVIRNFGGAAINIDAGSDGNTIVGNYLGAVDATGNLAAAANGSYTMYIAGANNIVGGTTAADRNVLGTSGAGGTYGLLVSTATATGNQILGNYIGIGADGSTAFSGSQTGISVMSGAATTRIDGNVIAANSDDGVYISTTGTGTVINNNLIGTNAAGTARAGTAADGIRAVTVGASTVFSNNVIAGASGYGIHLTSSTGGVTMQGNRIGTDAAGTANWGVQYDGIYLSSGNNNLIGGTGAGQGNVIAFSGQNGGFYSGIYAASGTGNAMLGNSIYGTHSGTMSLGIDLDTVGVNTNDSGDGDSGANNVQNFPVLSAATTNASNVVNISGTLNSTANSYFRIELFASPTANSNGYGEGKTYLGYVNVATNAGGNATFGTTLSAAVPVGYAISATATKSVAGYGSFTDTSEFAQTITSTAVAPGVLAVDTASDTLDGDTTSITTLLANKGADGFVSLREAITAANNTANVGGVADRINFAIAGTGVHTITVGSALPTITGAVVLDASTDDSFAANGNKPAIILDGNNGNFQGLELTSTADGSTIRGLVIRNFHSNGIIIDAGSDGNTIAGNYIGQLGASGTSAGTGNAWDGVYVLGANNIVGGTSAADRNVVSGNGFGIEISGAAASGNQLIGNYVGTDATGLATLGNASRGVGVFNGATGNTIGGSSTAQRNLIAGNGSDAIKIDGEASDNNVVRGNWIGIAADGATLLGNSGDGVFISNGADNTQLGGAGANDGNWIGGVSLVGIELDGTSTGTLIQGNRIGTDLAGTANWGPGQNGILIETSIGGAGPSATSIVGNTIAFSGQSNPGYNMGVRLSDTAGNGNTLSANSIYGSVGLGIDLLGDGVTANDAGDADTGANNLQNFPVLTLAKTDASNQVIVSGTLNSTANSYFRIEFFASPAGDATGYGEGQIYLGFANVATNGSGNATISATLSGVNVPAGYLISATATKSNAGYSAFTDTSEFAKNIVAIPTTQASIIVDTASDTLDGDTTSLSTLLASKGADGKVSLREAIIAANNTANGSVGVDRINFGIAPSGVQTITLASVLPNITDAVKIDGTTEGGYTSSPLIAVNGAGSSSNLLTLAAGSDGSTVRGLNLQNFAGYGLSISGSSGNTVAGNYIGTDATGSAASGTSLNPIYISNGNNNVIGGSTAADRNVIAGNYYSGLLASGTSTGNLIQGNYFGINAAGTAMVGGATIQIEMNAPGNTLGGSGAGQGNVIAGQLTSSWDYVDLWQTATGTTVQGNLIGLNAAGTAALTQSSSNQAGIYVRSSNNTIGGTTAGARNVIGGVTGYGIDIYNSGGGGANNTVQGNYIGTDITGTGTIANAQGGVRIQNGAASNTIGGTAAGAGNLIAGNTGNGVYVTSTAGTGNSILSNSINGNTALGINLQGGTQDGYGVTANDAGDADTGANNLQNTPVLSLVKTNGSGQLNVSGTLNSTASSYFRIELFASPTADNSGHGEGKTFIGYVNVATDASGNTSFSTTLSVVVPVGYVVTATATKSDAAYATFTDTSEFSAVLDAGTTPVNTVPGAQTVAEDLSGAITGVSVVDGGVITMTSSLSVLNGTVAVNLAGGATISSGANNSAALTLSGTAVQVNAALATLSYKGGANYNGSDTLTVLSTDASTLSDSDNVAITVTAVNDAPVLGAIAPTLTPITEDQTANAGQTVASFVGASITDVDSGAVQGIAITGLVSNTGTWQYSTNGGSSWSAVGAVSGNSALLLRSTDYVRFVPNGQNATTGSLTYRAWDQTSGSTGTKVDASTNGGTTAFSTASDTASITVTAVNDAPVLTPAAPTLTTITEDQAANAGQTVASFIGSSITDVDAGASNGIAITGQSAGNGAWQFSTNGGSSWAAMGAVNGSSALLLRSTDSVRFVPDGQNATTGFITYRAWDQTSGGAGSKVDASTNGTTTAFSLATDTASITVTTVNDAPVLTPAVPTLITITEDQTANAGQTVASFIGSSVTDVDTGAAQGIAITGLSSGNGSWQFSIDGGSSWSSVGAVGNASALLLRASDSIRFVPNGQNATSGSITYRAWDTASGSAGSKVGTAGNGGTTAFSVATDTAAISVSAVNDAPMLTPAAPTLTAISEDQTATTGQTVASFAGAAIGDVDTGAVEGIAITGLSAGTGAWQFSTDGGASWSAIGAVSGTSALLLRASDSVRFVPNGQNATTGSITYRGWDTTSGSAGSQVDASTNGGTTAFSSATDTASITVTAVNDAPVLAPIAPMLTPITEDQTANAGQTVASFVGAAITDVDTGAVQGIAITALTSGTGTWQFSTDSGNSWTNVGAVSGTSALLLRSSDSVRFVPDGQNATAGSITYRAWDQTSGSAGSKVDASASGGTTAFSLASDTASITVTAVNDAPVLAPAAPALAPLTEDQTANAGQTVASFLGASISDVDSGAVQGIAITGLASGNGTWQFSTDAGGTWTAVGAVSNSSALLLRATDAVRFVPDGQNATTASMTYRAWDTTIGSAGGKVSTAGNGGSTAFSLATDTASITVTAVNDAPVLSVVAPVLVGVGLNDAAPAGQTVASFAGTSIGDVDASALEGIAVTAVSTARGTWQYSTDGGSTWAAVGSVADNNALLLRATDKLRFVPDGSAVTTATLGYRAWDQTSGSAGSKVDASVAGGSTAFSAASDTASLAVSTRTDVAPDLGSAGTGTVTSAIGTNDLAQAAVVQADGRTVVAGRATVGGIVKAVLTRYDTDGSLDTSFGSGGQVATSFGGLDDRFFDLALQADGRIVVTGWAWNGSNSDLLVARYLGDGSLDTSFGTGGSTVLAIGPGNDEGYALAVQGDGKIVVAGAAYNGSSNDLALVRFNANGSLDTGFGSGGSVVTSVGSGDDTGLSLALQADGKILVAGATNAGAGNDVLLVRYNADGSLDTGFATGGQFIHNIASVSAGDIGYGVTQQSDGTILVVGRSDGDTLVLRLTAGGALDTGWGGTGQVVTAASAGDDYAWRVLQQADGKVVLGGQAAVGGNDDFALLRYNADGTLDTSFGGTGIVTTAIGTGDDRAYGMAMGADGKIVLAGYSAQAGGNQFATARYNADGSLDASFGMSALNNAAAFTEDGAAVVLAPTITVSDFDLNTGDNYAGASVTLQRSGGASADDRFSASGLLGALTEGGSLVYGGVTIGTVTTDSAGTLVLTFDANATQARIDGALRSIAYGNASNTPPASVVMGWTFSDGNTGAQGAGGALTATGQTTVTLTATNDEQVIGPNAGLVLAEGASATITAAMLATTDPEQSAAQLVYTLTAPPAHGALYRGAVQLVLNDSFTQADIDGGLLSYTNDGSEQAGDGFGFSVDDGFGSASAASFAITLSPVNDAPVFTGLDGAPTYVENGAPVVLDGNATVFDAEFAAHQNLVSPVAGQNADGATLTLVRHGGANAQDLFSATGNLQALTAGQPLVLSGVTIGSVTGNGGGTLVLSFDEQATQARVNEVLQSIAYANSSDAPPASVQIDWTFGDGNTGAQGVGGARSATGSTTVAITATNDAPVLTPAAPVLTPLTEDQTVNAGQTVASFLGGSITDADSGAAQGIAITGSNAGNGTWQFSTDGGGTWNAVGAVSDASALLLRATDSVRFVPDAQNATSASITYRAWDQTSGAFGNRVSATVNGGTTAFGAATDTASITVTAANDAPLLVPNTPSLTTIDEDQTSNAGQTVASFLGASITDADTGAASGIALHTIVAGTGTWQYSLDSGSSWHDVGAVSQSAALLLRAADRIRFVPDGQNAGSASIGYVAWDQTSGTAGALADASTGGGASAFSLASDTAAITVTAVNDAPVLTTALPTLAGITEDQTVNAGQTVASFLGSSIADIDSGALQGIAITGLTEGNGAWQFSTDSGSTWNAVGTVSDASALLLRASDSVRFVPDGANATSASLTYRAWDQSSGAAGSKASTAVNGGTSAFGTATDTATITVTAVNDAPVLTPAAPVMATISEDQTANAGQTVASFLGSSVADVDSGALQGISVIGLGSGNGAWQYSVDGGSTWSAVGTVSGTSALLLRASDSVRFVPDGLNATTGTITYRAWDATSGSVGNKVDASATGTTTAFSLASDTATITVTAVNDAPVLAPAAPALASITEDQIASTGQTVASFLGASISDVDSGAVQGIAVTSLASGNGTWQYSTDAGSTWAAIGAVSNSSALLLRAADAVRFVPDGQNATTGSITYRAWDTTSGNAGDKTDTAIDGGSTAFSLATDTASISVTAVNDAPVLTPAAPVLNTISEDQLTNAGQTVASFLGSSIADVDSGALQGIAITGLNAGNDTWQYSVDGGSSWAAAGTVDDSAALLLGANDLLRFVPDGQNATNGSISYRAWDQSSGTAGTRADASVGGGTSAFGLATDTATITVTDIDDAPVLTPATPVLTPLTEDQTANAGQTVASFLGSSITDADSGAAQGIAITGSTAGSGAWQFSTDGGSTWAALGTVSDASALLLRATDSIRFVPDGANATSASFTYRAWDQTSGAFGGWVSATVNGGTTAFSSASDTASITVTAVNDAPVLVPAAPTLTTLAEDQTANAGQTVASFIGASITDADSGAANGIAITGLASGTGNWQYSIDGGSSWHDVGPVTDSAALLLRATDSVRFVPDGQAGTSASITYVAWDQSTGTAGTLADASVGGGASAFSAASDTATITVTDVNDAPALTPTAPVLAPLTEDQTTNTGQTVASFIGGSITDADGGALPGIAITGLDSGNGAWQFSTDGGASWAAVGAVSEASALLLRATDSIRFVPDGANATSGTITYRAWDSTSGSAGSQADASSHGGTTAFSAATDTATIAVTTLNDAPVLTPAAPTLATIDEEQTTNSGQTVASFIGGSITDADLGAAHGIAITAADAGRGTWQFSIDGGTSWTDLGAVGDTAALLLRATDSIRFVPDGQNATAGSITYRAWDQSGDSAGSRADASVNGGSSAFSLVTDTASITVISTNDSPVLNPMQPTLATIAADQTANTGQSVAAIVGNSIADPDAGALQGIAVTAADGGSGAWQYSLDNGSTWNAIGAVSDASALLLRPTDLVRLVPDGTHGGSASITYRAWDQTAGSAGGRADTQAGPQATSGFSAASDTASIAVTAVDAPVIDPPVVEPPVIDPPPVNRAPVITSNGGASTAAISVAENSSAVTVVEATDADVSAQALGFSIVGGADAARFTIDAHTGALAFVEAPDFETPRDAGADNVYDLIVQASDGTLAVAQSIAVSVLNVNDNAPQITSDGGGASAAVAVPEGDAVVTHLTATDADGPLGTLAFSIVGGADAARFTIDVATGDLRFVQAPAFDPAGTNRYDVIVGVSDGTLSRTQALTIGVMPTPVTPPPTPVDPVAPAAPAAPVDPPPPATPANPATPVAPVAPPAALVAPAPPEAASPVAAASPSTAPVRLAVPITTLPTGPAGGAGIEPISAGRPWVTRSAPTLVLHSIEPAHSLAVREQGAYPVPRVLTMQAYFDATQAGASAEHHLDDLQAGPPADAELAPEMSGLQVALVGSLAATAGVLLWASRGAALLTSLLVSAPAWRGYDLLPVLRRDEKSRLDVGRHEPSPAELEAELAEEPDERNAQREDDTDAEDDETDTPEESTHPTATSGAAHAAANRHAVTETAR